MKVGIIGSGGREHAICQNIKNSKKISEIYCFQVMQEQKILQIMYYLI